MKIIYITFLVALLSCGCSGPIGTTSQSQPGSSDQKVTSEAIAISIATNAMPTVLDGTKEFNVWSLRASSHPPPTEKAEAEYWIVTYAHGLHGNWTVKIDAATGEILEKKRGPSR